MANNRYCVYVHTNKKDGKKYVGCTKLNPLLRWQAGGKGYLKGHDSFSKAIEEDGWDNFSHEILVYGIKTQQEAESLELKYMRDFNSFIPNGYNVEGKNVREKRPLTGWHHSEETRRKISESLKSVDTHPIAQRKNHSKPVDMFDPNGNLIKTFYGASEASRVTGVDVSTIAKCCKNEHYNKTGGGYIWKYHHKEELEYEVV